MSVEGMGESSLLLGGDMRAGHAGIWQPWVTGNRHGLIAGATGTGKTVSLQVLAEAWSRAGVPVFAVDAKGDLSGLAAAGSANKEITRRLGLLGEAAAGHGFAPSPVVFWDVFGEQGHPLRTTVSELGPLLLANLLDLNDTQSGIIYAAFAIADDEGLLLLDLKDLRSLLAWMGDNAADLRSDYGNISRASLGAIQRRLLVLEEQGAEQFLGEPALELSDIMRTDFSGNGVISLLAADQLMQRSPELYSAMMLWLLSELYESLPERGDAERPALVVFIDEAHLLFNRMPRAVQDKVEQVVRLIRSKGVGLYFVTQAPLDVPEVILGQLGLKVQHALRAFTARDRRSIKAVADNFRQAPGLEVATVVAQLGLGEALVSVLDERGTPTPVQAAMMAPPRSSIGALDAAERKRRIQSSPLAGRYDKPVDRESAYELLKKRAELAAADALEAARVEAAEKQRARQAAPKRSSRGRQTVAEAMMKSVARSVGSALGRRLVRGLLGSLLK